MQGFGWFPGYVTSPWLHPNPPIRARPEGRLSCIQRPRIRCAADATSRRVGRQPRLSFGYQTTGILTNEIPGLRFYSILINFIKELQVYEGSSRHEMLYISQAAPSKIRHIRIRLRFKFYTFSLPGLHKVMTRDAACHT